MQQEGTSGPFRALKVRGPGSMCTATFIALHKELAMAHVLDIRDIHVFDGLLRRLEAILDSLMLPFAEEVGRLSPAAFRHLLNARF